MAFISEGGMCFNWNTWWPQTVKAHKASGPDYKYFVAPIYAQAFTNYDNETTPMSTIAWQQRYATWMKFFIEQ